VITSGYQHVIASYKEGNDEKTYSFTLLCVCLTLLLIPTVSFGATKAPNVEPNATRDYSFKVLVPNFGTTYFPVNYNPSDPSTYYIMSPGKYVIVQRTDSVNRSAVFRAVDASTKTPLSDWVIIWNGESKLVYTNTSGKTQYIRFEISSSNITSFWAQGFLSSVNFKNNIKKRRGYFCPPFIVEKKGGYKFAWRNDQV